MRVAATAADAQPRVADLDLQLVGTDTCQVDLHDPALTRLVNVGSRIPQPTRRHHSPIPADQRELTVIVWHGKRISTDYTDVNQCNLWMSVARLTEHAIPERSAFRNVLQRIGEFAILVR